MKSSGVAWIVGTLMNDALMVSSYNCLVSGPYMVSCRNYATQVVGAQYLESRAAIVGMESAEAGRMLTLAE